ncbi:MAG TPA: helix-turn-helix domain-containing protein [Streptosporangiaceae bacterium]|nr:helix-turn-helix domain-containing protein [Streptosporangiaceae bacterium]
MQFPLGAADAGVTCRAWRGRFAARGLPGPEDLPRTGRPRRISAAERAEVCALACQLPAATGVPLARWSCPELAAELARAGLVSAISPSSVRRILAEHPVKPWQYQSWIFPRNPDFAAKASVVLDLYQGFFRPWDHDRVAIMPAQLTGVHAGQWAYKTMITTVPTCAT